MKDRNLEKLFQAAGRVRLTEGERASMRAYVHTCVRNIGVGRHLFNMQIIAFILAAVLVGGGVSVAAENSLPGEPLHSVKVNVNERVRAALATSTEADAQVELSRMDARLKEAETLNAQGRLDADTQTRIEQNFERHAARAEELITRLEAEGKAEQAARLTSGLETSLEAHERILTKLEAKDEVKEEMKEEKKEGKVEGETKVETETEVETNGEVELKLGL